MAGSDRTNGGLGAGLKRTRGQIRASTELLRLPRAQPALAPGGAEWTSDTQALSFRGDNGGHVSWTTSPILQERDKCKVRAESGALLCRDQWYSPVLPGDPGGLRVRSRTELPSCELGGGQRSTSW